jgi:hypothetical protein
MNLFQPILDQLTAIFSQLTPIPLENPLAYIYTIVFNFLLFMASLGGFGS